MKACVIFNPVARGDKARLFQSHLTDVARQCSLKPTTCAGAARALATEAVNEGYETIVAAGGDGTVNEVLNGIADASEGLQRTQLGILPLGTANVFAKELGIPVRFHDAWQVVCAGKETLIDAPLASYFSEGKPMRRYFAQMGGAGLDSRAIELVDWEAKKRLGWLAYVLAGFRALAGPLPDIVVSNGRETASGKLVLIGNGKFYGGRFNVFPLADLSDGVLEVVVYPRLALETIVRAGWGMASGNFHTGRQTMQLKGPVIEVTATAGALFHLDGENVAPLPATFTVERRALRVLVP